MSLLSENVKKEYENLCKETRIKNFKRLREEIAKMSQANFSRAIDFTKNDITLIEAGEKKLSVFHIQRLKDYFKDNFNIELSADYLMGYTEVMENHSKKLSDDIGLSGDALCMLRVFKNGNEIQKQNLKFLNTVLEWYYKGFRKDERNSFYTIFYMMYEYINASEYITKKYEHTDNSFTDTDCIQIYKKGDPFNNIGHNINIYNLLPTFFIDRIRFALNELKKENHNV